MASLQPPDNFYTNGNSLHSSISSSPEAEKMLRNPDGSPGPEADAIPDGLELNTDVNYSTMPQPYHPPQPQTYYDQDRAHATQADYSQATYQHSPPLSNPEKAPKGEGRICGLSKPTFCLLVVCLVLLCALIAVAGALGAVIASKNSQISDLAAASACSASATPSSNAVPSESVTPSSSVTPSASATAVAALDLSQPAPTDTAIALNKCPGVSSQLTWEVPGTNLTFSKDCGMDYMFNDIAQVPAKNFEECVRYCAAFSLQPQSRKGPCKGVVYIFKGEQGEDGNWCWMKYSKNTQQSGAKDYTESAWLL
ncbi:hypothetical protein CCHL11_09396 [Colletotrichum chlorophyti]|uniref:Apple domain-containing protein n=1 Tax=Colletotrichum chlorophyti TaxID=708187 RepID=A0A1Q8R9P9_9PEZI|nr:hypothetical protein CCHL11_09396 [Colletotrichum chlorophyti]